MKLKRFRFISYFLVLTFVLFGMGIDIIPLSTAKSSNKTIFFYNPETNINNFASLKISIDAHLAKFNQGKFQPFDNKLVFEDFIAKQSDGVFMLSSWHYRQLQKKLLLKPILVGTSKGKATQRKILSVNQEITNLEQLHGKTIAVSGSKNYSASILKQIFAQQNGKILDDVTLLLVPKDIDALMAVGFGMASAALTSEKSLEKLKLINPKQYSLLKAFGYSDNKFLTIVAVPRQTATNTNALLDIIEQMGTSQEGKTKLKLLGLDGWRKLTASEIKAFQNKGEF